MNDEVDRVAYFDKDFRPTSKENAALVKVVYKDGRMVFGVPDDNGHAPSETPSEETTVRPPVYTLANKGCGPKSKKKSPAWKSAKAYRPTSSKSWMDSVLVAKTKEESKYFEPPTPEEIAELKAIVPEYKDIMVHDSVEKLMQVQYMGNDPTLRRAVAESVLETAKRFEDMGYPINQKLVDDAQEWLKAEKAKEKKRSGKGSYPWDECIADQMKQYGDMETAKKVCGKIRAASQFGKSERGSTLLAKSMSAMLK